MIDNDGVIGRLDLLFQYAEDGIIFEEMGQGFGIGQVVDGHKLNTRVLACRPKEIPADPAKSIDSDLDTHLKTS
jgi:hypothetical protein